MITALTFVGAVFFLGDFGCLNFLRLYVIIPFTKGSVDMIILISGASHAGKTALAQKLLEKYKYPYLSIDHLKMGLIRSGQTSLTPEDDDELTEYLWPIVREMIKTAIENKQNLIVEGCYIPFDWQRDFPKEYLPKSLSPSHVVYTIH